jgi:predicted lipid-binding transport protein (Tim44 family)
MDPVILIFGGVAAFVIYRLFSALGTRTGHEQRRDPASAQRAGEAAADAETEVRRAPVSPAAEPVRVADPSFDEKAFLDGARAAYEMIVEAFTAGDLKSIRSFVNESVYEAFRTAVSEREARGLAPELKFVGIDSASIVSSDVGGGVMTITADFTSNQVRVTRDRNGEVVEGDPNRIDLVKDRWTFTRKAASNDPNWILVATGAAG